MTGPTQREQFFESCRAPGSPDARAQLEIAQALDEEELSRLRAGLREGVDSGAWAERVEHLQETVEARAKRLKALSLPR